MTSLTTILRHIHYSANWYSDGQQSGIWGMSLANHKRGHLHTQRTAKTGNFKLMLLRKKEKNQCKKKRVNTNVINTFSTEINKFDFNLIQQKICLFKHFKKLHLHYIYSLSRSFIQDQYDFIFWKKMLTKDAFLIYLKIVLQNIIKLK